ncbi:MAG TPA: hypothetical protein VMT32_15865 [Bryobacteraceae bacterium]|nr:hypothetical protein [Bryobacteraceae bacterium]
MGLMMRIAALLCLGCAMGSAGNWSGVLVDSKCYDTEERNVNPFDGSTDVDHDRGLEIRICRPSAHTKSFSVVQQDGVSFRLNAPGNANAAGLVRKAGKKTYFVVTVAGEMSKGTAKVDSISMIR